MARMNLVATAAFGLETVVSYELKDLGYTELTTENGRVKFQGDYRDVAYCNIHLRCANKLFIEMATFKALDFEELFQGVKSVIWEDMLPLDAEIIVTAKSVKSALFSLRDIQAISKKAIIESIKRKYDKEEFPETGPRFHIEISILKDKVAVLLNTSGEGLHKRGYRGDTGDAPLRETLAASLISLSRWNSNRILADPFCGSGTIAIEAALKGINRAPGILRKFESEAWPCIPTKIWDKERENARLNEIKPDFKILASDFDYHVFKHARENAETAGVAEYIDFQKKPMQEFNSKHKFGCIICNPPYGVRISDEGKLKDLYKDMGQLIRKLDTWSFFIFSAFEKVESCIGTKSDKNRKLYNGKIKTYLYQYLRPLPPRK